MIVPPFSENDNDGFPKITHRFFDDQQIKREHALQLYLKQLAPSLLESGRDILRYCHLCQKPWYEMGSRASLLCLSLFQLAEIAQQLGVKVCTPSSLPVQICPLCASLHLGGIPKIEEYLDDQGYRFSWQARTLLHTRLFCHIYRWNLCSISEMLREMRSAPCDVLTTSMDQIRSVLSWLKTLAEPDQEEAVLLRDRSLDIMSRYEAPEPGFAWCGYGWKSQCPLLGDVLVALGMTFPDSSICSPGLLVACWRQIACAIERMLVC
jgi:hypothetical protein